MYKLIKINSKEKWNNFIHTNEFEFYSFICSWEWTKVQESLGKKVFKYGIYKEGSLIGILPLIVNKAKRGTYLFAPHTPLIKKDICFFKVLEYILENLKKIGKKNNANFIRFNSPIVISKQNKFNFKKLGFIDAPMHEHAEDTYLLDLTKTEEEIFKKIKKKDRYYINRAIKEGVEIIKGNNQLQINKLISMHLIHSKKIGYNPFSEKFIKNLYNIFGDNINIISAKYKGKIESILMTIKFGKTCVYYISSSDIIHSKFSPNYLCQWEAIKQAKKDNCEIYNFWGISPDDNLSHPISGVTKFKKKFGGYNYSLLHTQDLILSKKYWINRIIETLRRKKRGYYYKKITN